MEDSEISNWDRLPMLVKIDIFTMLDRDSRLALQLTSRSNCEISSYCPHVLKGLDIKEISDGTPVPQFSLKSSILLPDSRCLVQEKRLDMKKAAEQFVELFKNKKSFVKELKLTSGPKMNTFLRCISRAIGAHIRHKGINYKYAFRVEQIHWVGDIDEQCKEFFDLLTYFDTSVLESIKIENWRMGRLSMVGLIRTYQYENAKKFFLQAMVDIPVDCYLHFNCFEVKLPVLKGKDLLKVVKKFRTEPLPIDSFFHIIVDERVDGSILDDVFALLSIPMEERESISSHDHNHVSKHSCHDPNTVFILKMDEDSFYGCIVSNDADQRTRMDLSVYMNLREMGVDFNDL